MSSRSTLNRLRREVGDLLDARSSGRSLDDFAAYRDDPVGFIEDVLEARLWHKQREIAEAVVTDRYVVVRGCHASGKDYLAARFALWWVFARRGLVVLTGPVERQVKEILMRKELRPAWQAADLPGELYEMALRVDGTGGVLAFSAGTDPSKMTGFHHPNGTLFVISEAQGVDAEVWTSAIANTASKESAILAVGNPIFASGRFFTASKSTRWRAVRMSALEHPNVTGEGEPIPGAVTEALIEAIRSDLGEESAEYRSRVLAEFPDSDDSGLFARTWLDASVARQARPLDGPPVVAVDPARLGGDSTIMAVRRGTVVEPLISIPGGDTMTTVGRLKAKLEGVGVYPTRDSVLFSSEAGESTGKVIVDSTGLGSGVGDRLRELGFNVHEFIGARTPRNSERYLNLRAESYFHLRESLERGRVTLPPDEDLFEELLATRWEPTSSGKRRIESKTGIRSRLGRSPDRADAVSMVVYPTATASRGGRLITL